MLKKEAKALAAQLKIELPNVQTVAAFEAALDAKGLSIGIENATGDWVVLDTDRVVHARCE